MHRGSAITNPLGIVKRGIQRADPKAVEKRARSTCATIHGAMGRVGLMKSCLRPVRPAAQAGGSAATVLLQPGDNWMLQVAAEQTWPGDIVVAVCTANNTDGCFGDLLATSFVARGAVGLNVQIWGTGGMSRQLQGASRMPASPRCWRAAARWISGSATTER